MGWVVNVDMFISSIYTKVQFLFYFLTAWVEKCHFRMSVFTSCQSLTDVSSKDFVFTDCPLFFNIQIVLFTLYNLFVWKILVLSVSCTITGVIVCILLYRSILPYAMQYWYCGLKGQIKRVARKILYNSKFLRH